MKIVLEFDDCQNNRLYATCVHGIILCHGDIMDNNIFFVENFDYVWNHEIVITGFESKLRKHLISGHT